MFNFFKKKSPVESLIQSKGIEHSAAHFAEIIIERLKNIEIAYQFVLEELDAARRGNDLAISFVASSRVSPIEYENALLDNNQIVNDVQGFLHDLCNQIMHDIELTILFRCMIVDNVMKHFYLGKYYKVDLNQLSKEEFAQYFEAFSFYDLDEAEDDEDEDDEEYVDEVEPYELKIDLVKVNEILKKLENLADNEKGKIGGKHKMILDDNDLIQNVQFEFSSDTINEANALANDLSESMGGVFGYLTVIVTKIN